MAADTEPRKCKSCGCTEQAACLIQVTIVRDGAPQMIINRGCSWSRDNPEYCTACEAVYLANQNETEVLMDLFPVEFAKAAKAQRMGR